MPESRYELSVAISDYTKWYSMESNYLFDI